MITTVSLVNISQPHIVIIFLLWWKLLTYILANFVYTVLLIIVTMLYNASPEQIYLMTVSFNLWSPSSIFFSSFNECLDFLRAFALELCTARVEVWGSSSWSRQSQKDGSGFSCDVWVWDPFKISPSSRVMGLWQRVLYLWINQEWRRGIFLKQHSFW